MSKSITEKELAETLRAAVEDRAYDTGTSTVDDWQAAARLVAELLGVELAPQHPEPGTWVFDGRPTLVDPEGRSYMQHRDMSVEVFEPGQLDMDTNMAKPARTVPAESVVLTRLQVGEIYDRTQNSPGPFCMLSYVVQKDIQDTVNAARRKLLEASK